MCGIFGLVLHSSSGFKQTFIKKSLTTLALLSESRGKDSSGLVLRNEAEGVFQVLKGPVTLNYLLKRKEVAHQIDRVIESFCNRMTSSQQTTFAALGHSRLVTNGSQSEDLNNQPVVKDGVIGIHNGIIVNDSDLWARYPEIQRTAEIDTEVMLALVRKHIRDGLEIDTAISKTLGEIIGTVSAAFFIDDLNALALTTNNGSLYILTDGKGLFAFASEEYFLKRLAKTMNLDGNFDFRIQQVIPNKVLLVDLVNLKLREFTPSMGISRSSGGFNKIDPYRIVEQSFSDGRPQKTLIVDPSKIAAHPRALAESVHLEFNLTRILALRRCNKCILPETFPFIEYDDHGICNYCNSHVIKNRPKPIDELIDLVRPYRRSDGGYDCIVPYSGGRDSTHTLHIIKTVLKLNPVAFTYDWGMVNDLARRNIARVCGKLGIENIIVSADISRKRENIRKNVLAWLGKPHLGMVPLFMAGDKYFFYYTDQVRRQTGVRLNIWGINSLENTDFKVGFLGVPPDFHKRRIYSLSATRQARLFSGIAINLVNNPRYLNSSVWDTLGSFVSRSIVPHRDYFHMYDYLQWDEKEINKLVLSEYNWERAIDSNTTWRIGDGTAPFYNYIYYTVAGFSEYDTFRSNQIREGMLSRTEAMDLVMNENRPRYPSIKWYTDIININFESTIRRINDIPKLYQ